MKRRKTIKADTRLPGEKRESKMKIWFDDSYLGLWLLVQRLKIQNHFRK